MGAAASSEESHDHIGFHVVQVNNKYIFFGILFFQK